MTVGEVSEACNRAMSRLWAGFLDADFLTVLILFGIGVIVFITREIILSTETKRRLDTSDGIIQKLILQWARIPDRMGVRIGDSRSAYYLGVYRGFSLFRGYFGKILSPLP